jgi:hypothetical protein
MCNDINTGLIYVSFLKEKKQKEEHAFKKASEVCSFFTPRGKDKPLKNAHLAIRELEAKREIIRVRLLGFTLSLCVVHFYFAALLILLLISRITNKSHL